MATESAHRAEHDLSPDGHPAAQDRRSVNDMIKELRDQITALLRDEVALAKSEMSEKLTKVALNGGYLAAGALVAFAGLIVLLMALSAGLYVALVAAGLSNATAGWLAPLIIGGAVVAIGYGLVQKAISTFSEESLFPERTADSVRENAQWMKEKVT